MQGIILFCKKHLTIIMLKSLPVSKTSLILLYKFFILLSAFSMFFLLYQMILTSVLDTTFSVMLSHHQAVKCLGWATLLHVILIKLGVYMKGGAKHDVLFYIHLVAAIIFTVSVMVLVFSYQETSTYHASITLLASISYTIVAFIGIPMLLKRF